MNTKIKSGLIALAVAVAAVTTLNFDAKSVNKDKVTAVTYRYQLNTVSGAKDPVNWILVSNSSPSCGIAGEVPCKVHFDSSTYTDITNYLSQFSIDEQVSSGPGVITKE
ncbi:hypothetical protein [Pedobacter nutrimenti]|uniref:hypothetical protein n=1 Tax=Pedobacter nutrimenti TaxID=1241337 RepID=UPI00292FD621|nr:hypothetical protein [Pedobacter nutrimenti]